MTQLLIFILALSALAVASSSCLHGLSHPTKSVYDEFLKAKRAVPYPAQTIADDLPKNFDTRQAFPGCIGAVLNQGQCGSCWAFASTEVLSDRFCIQSGGRINVTLSPQDALGCEELHYGCAMGSMPEWAWPFLVKKGVTTMECTPYTSGQGNAPKHCPTTCTGSSNGANMTKYHAANYTHAGNFFDARKHTAAIMQALMSGPLDSLFEVYGDFDDYVGGTVYQHKTGSFEGLHNVKIIGWGEEESTGELYWHVQNSWGLDWPVTGSPQDGTFKIKRGVDECMFESQVYYGSARI